MSEPVGIQEARAAWRAGIITPRRKAVFFAVLVGLGLLAPLAIYPVFLMNVLVMALFASAFNLLLGYAGWGVGHFKNGRYAEIQTEQGLFDNYIHKFQTSQSRRHRFPNSIRFQVATMGDDAYTCCGIFDCSLAHHQGHKLAGGNFPSRYHPVAIR